MAQFLLLLHDKPTDFSGYSAEEMQSVIAEYSAWREDLIARKLFLGGQKLKDEGGRHLSTQDGRVQVVDGPYSEAKEVLGGYFMLEADDYPAAVNISRECPHLKYGGRIEVREIDAMHD